MKLGSDTRLRFSATDLAGHLACRHLTRLRIAEAHGRIERPSWSNPVADAIRERGEEHERRYLEHLRGLGLDVVDLSGVARTSEGPKKTRVSLLAERLGPASKVGTVDKFQGQEAPVVVYSMTSSSPEDAPRGMEFLYSLNRFNVATSRAQCAAIVVAGPRLFAPECRKPRQMELANAYCRYLELARHAPASP